jgi:hypothetical protein
MDALDFVPEKGVPDIAAHLPPDGGNRIVHGFPIQREPGYRVALGLAPLAGFKPAPRAPGDLGKARMVGEKRLLNEVGDLVGK